MDLYCLGLYCGRIRTENGTWSDCGVTDTYNYACPRGYSVVHWPERNYQCLPCMGTPTFYSWLYLGFMAVLPLVLEWYLIDQTVKRRNFTKELVLLHISALIENVVASLLSLLIISPTGKLMINSCQVHRLSDWYTMLHNPNPGYKTTLRCTQEAVYPLYSIVFIDYALVLVLLFLCRPILVGKVLRGEGKKSVYLTMYLIPGLAVLHATCCGLLYYAFPYIVIIMSVVSVAAHLAFRLDQSMKSLLISTFKDVRNLVILLGHWLLHAYGIVAITQLKEPLLNGALISLVPFPAFFYILTSKFTDPSKLHIN
ncbi:JNK1/MAPK8-associated membrane protein-like isoform X1 [Limulus polyphemus]|uniref:JNK1/MAPK8-associated membrane protein-like isoform X1 n=1 Tax=Limulus polyphemus TaxID=6850 RepID=A0ABM1T472_LIMPO|nr:JNK1/MAPK8-associated membrane protein-like isoform X1 [Limulus polyphemus]